VLAGPGPSKVFGRQIGKRWLESLLPVWFSTIPGAAQWLPKSRPHKERVLGGLWVLCNHWWVLEVIADP